jgi:putative nucleotidyltransferase with HDIG domain
MSEDSLKPPDLPLKLCRLPVVRPVVAKIKQVLDSRTEFGPLLRLCALEPGIAAELLVAANVPEYGFAGRIYTVEEAVRMLGWERTRSLVRSIVNTAQPADDRRDAMLHACWIHSLSSAFFASEMALFFGVEEDRAYAIGLMHDIGRLGLLSAFPDQYLEVMQHRYPTLAEFLAAEVRAVGMDHVRAGLSLTRSWGLPEDFSLAAGQHHDVCADNNGPVSALVRLACRLAHTSGFPAEPCDQASLSAAVGGDETPLDQVLTEVQTTSLAKLWEHIDPFWPALGFAPTARRH